MLTNPAIPHIYKVICRGKSSIEATGTIIEEMAPLRLSKATRSPRRAGRAPTDPPSERATQIDQDIEAGDAPRDAEVQMRCAAAASVARQPDHRAFTDGGASLHVDT